MPSLKTITFEHVPVMFKHFSGHPRPFNQYDREGGRSFDIRLDPEQFDDDAIKRMEQDELRVSQWVPKNGGDPIWHLPVNCSFTDSNGARVKVPPRFYIIEGDNVTELESPGQISKSILGGETKLVRIHAICAADISAFSSQSSTRSTQNTSMRTMANTISTN